MDTVRIVFTILLFTLVQILCASNPDSLLEVQIQKTTKYYREVRELTKEIGITNQNLEKYFNSTTETYSALDTLSDAVQLNSDQIQAFRSEDKKEEFKWSEFWSNLFIEIAGAFVGAFAAIWIFYNQIKADRQKDRDRKDEEYRENNFYLSSLINTTLSKVEEQRIAIKNFYEAIEENPTVIPIIGTIPMQDLRRLAKVVDNEIYYYSFLEEFGKTKDVVNKYRGITVSVDYLDSAMNQMEDVLWKGLNFDRERKLEFQKKFEDGMDMAVEYAKRFESVNPDFSNTIYEYTGKYHKGSEEEKSDLRFIESQYITPLKYELVKGFSGIQEARHIITNLKQLSYSYVQIINNNKRHALPFKGYVDNFEKALKEVEKHSIELRKKHSLQLS